MCICLFLICLGSVPVPVVDIILMSKSFDTWVFCILDRTRHLKNFAETFILKLLHNSVCWLVTHLYSCFDQIEDNSCYSTIFV